MEHLRKKLEKNIQDIIRERRDDKNFKVYYKKKMEPSFDTPASFNMKDYSFLVSVYTNDKSDVFGIMQAEVWSPEGEARDLIRTLELDHTSMSVGDLIEDEEGRFFYCAPMGWGEIEMA